mmetsp:Transcript_71271/g.197920  ORF Transcript_71271/g.197920 Transcript_71271/m.197920 type:complete len:216 (+) Transcript_71271:206-853(+)
MARTPAPIPVRSHARTHDFAVFLTFQTQSVAQLLQHGRHFRIQVFVQQPRGAVAAVHLDVAKCVAALNVLHCHHPHDDVEKMAGARFRAPSEVDQERHRDGVRDEVDPICVDHHGQRGAREVPCIEDLQEPRGAEADANECCPRGGAAAGDPDASCAVREADLVEGGVRGDRDNRENPVRAWTYPLLPRLLWTRVNHPPSVQTPVAAASFRALQR